MVKLIKLNESANVVYDNGGMKNSFYLDFNNPDDLYRELEKNCGYDFATQFRDEFENWKEIEIDEVRESCILTMGDVQSSSDYSSYYMNRLMSLLSEDSLNIDDIKDTANELNECINGTENILNDFFKYGVGSDLK